MITELRGRASRPTVRHAQVIFEPGSTRLDTAATVSLSQLTHNLPLGINPVTTVTAITRNSAVNPQPRLAAMLRAWKVSSYLREAGLGGTLITRTSLPTDESTQPVGTVVITVEYLE